MRAGGERCGGGEGGEQGPLRETQRKELGGDRAAAGSVPECDGQRGYGSAVELTVFVPVDRGGSGEKL